MEPPSYLPKSSLVESLETAGQISTCCNRCCSFAQMLELMYYDTDFCKLIQECSTYVFRRKDSKNLGLNRDLNPGPPAPEAGIIPLDHWAAMICRLQELWMKIHLQIISLYHWATLICMLEWFWMDPTGPFGNPTGLVWSGKFRTFSWGWLYYIKQFRTLKAISNFGNDKKFQVPVPEALS